MTVAQAALFLMRHGATPCEPSEVPKGAGRNRCDQCLRWTPCVEVWLTRFQRAELCLDCRLGRTRFEDVVQPSAPNSPIGRKR